MSKRVSELEPDLLLESLVDACIDSLKLLPFLFLTYLFMEWLEHGAGDRFEKTVARSGAAGPLVGALLGVVPQCGFSGAAATLYAGRVVSLGTLVSVFLVTSDEMLPVMISQAVDPAVILKILAIKIVCGMLVGVVLDACLRAVGRGHEGFGSRHMHDGHSGHDIHRLCEQEGCECARDCDCDHCLERTDCVCEHALCNEEGHAHECEHGLEEPHNGGHAHDHTHSDGRGQGRWGHLALAALRHSLQITVFVFVICLLLNIALSTGVLEQLQLGRGGALLETVVAGLLGFIPNCAISVGLTQLYLEGALGAGGLMSGLLVNAGIGLIVLLRTNNDSRENLRICGLLLVVAVVTGLLVAASGIL